MKKLLSIIVLVLTLGFVGYAFAVDVVASSTINVGWTQTGGSPAVDLRIECSAMSGGPYTGENLVVTPPASTTRRVDAVFGTTLGQRYCTLVARNSAGNSARSAELNLNYVSAIITPPVGTATLGVTP